MSKPNPVWRCPCGWIGDVRSYCRDGAGSCPGHCGGCKDPDISIERLSPIEAAVWRGQQEERKIER